MPVYRIDGVEYDIPRGGVLIDTNVVVARFDPRDENHDRAVGFLAVLDGRPFFPVLPVSVLIESWGVLVGGKRQPNRTGCEMLAWALEPGTAIVLPDFPTRLDQVRELASELEIDVVDVVLIELSSCLQRECRLDDPLPIASFDQRDFYKALGRVPSVIRLMDLESLDIYDHRPRR